MQMGYTKFQNLCFKTKEDNTVYAIPKYIFTLHPAAGVSFQGAHNNKRSVHLRFLL